MFLLRSLTVLAFLTLAAMKGVAADPLNVLLITADDLGLQLSCYGNDVIETPSLDRLASQGTRFEVAYVAQASCSPSRSALFTGLFPHANGQYGLTNANVGFRLHVGLVDQTIPAHLKRAGYRTGIIGKLHVNPEGEFPFDQRVKGDIRDVRYVSNQAATFFEEGNQPFFLMVNYTDPHAARTNRQSRDWHFPNQVKGLPVDPLKAGEAPPLPFQGVDDPAQLERVAGYYNCVKRLDSGVGLLLEALEAAGKADKTLVILVGDHGPPFDRGKTTCYEGGLRVPLLVRWPGVGKVKVSPALASTVDVLPTILDAAGLKNEAKLHGRSLRPVLESEEAEWRTFLPAEFHFHGAQPFYPRRCVRDDRYHLIHNLRAGEARPPQGIDGDKAHRFAKEAKYEGTDVAKAFATYADPPEFELYDLQEDPWEFHNIAGQPEVAEAEARLRKGLLDWRRQTEDPLLDPARLAEMAKIGNSSRP